MGKWPSPVEEQRQSFPHGLEEILPGLAQLLAASDKAEALVLLINAECRIEDGDYDNYDGGTMYWTLGMYIPAAVFGQLEPRDRKKIEEQIEVELREIGVGRVPGDLCHVLHNVRMKPRLAVDPQWRDSAKRWLSGAGVSNQGRARSTNIATRQHDGLLFRSRPEELIYEAFKALGVVFAPLAVFLYRDTTNTGRRIEPDFVVFQEGKLMVVEVDGDSFHTENPAQADGRTRIFKVEGAFIERIAVNECDTPEKARVRAQRALDGFARWRASL